MRDEKEAADELDRWIDRALLSLQTKAQTEYIKYHANSSQSESCNALIQALIRIGKGFRNLANLTALILLKCSQLVIPLANRFQLTSEQKLELRNRAREYRLRREAERRRAAQERGDPAGNAAACP